jgi:hypothetical protein
MPDYGRDFRTLSRFDWTLIEAKQNLIEAAYWRLVTPRGALEYDPDYGLDIRLFVQRPWNTITKYELETMIAAELEKDIRFNRVFVDTTQESLEQIKIGIRIELEDEEEFELVLKLSKMTVEVLRANP